MFRFTIRDVLWLMVVVGLAVGWCVGHGKSNSMIKRRDERLHALAQKLADETNKLIFMPNEDPDKEYVVGPSSGHEMGLPYLSIP